MLFASPAGIVALRFVGLWNNRKIKQEPDDIRGNQQVGEKIHDEVTNSQVIINDAITESCRSIKMFMLEKGIPGLVVQVAIGGNRVWKMAFGYCDAENLVECNPDAAMRIGSISKSIFAASEVAPLIEEGKLKLEDSIHKFLSEDEFPKKKFDNIEVDITLSQLLNHTSGIRHYRLTDEKLRPIGSGKSIKTLQHKEEYEREELYQRKTFRNIMDALSIFRNDPLEKKPGSFNYSTYNYTLLAAVIQKILQQQASKSSMQVEDDWMRQLRYDWDLKNTRLDIQDQFVPYRARFYKRNTSTGALMNATLTDDSYKWSGGGLISNTDDLIKFGKKLIECHKRDPEAMLKKETIDLLWTEHKENYGLGFSLRLLAGEKVVYHIGFANGACSILLLSPRSEIVIALMFNLGSLSAYEIGEKVFKHFDSAMRSNNAFVNGSKQ